MAMKTHFSGLLVIFCLIYPNKGLLQDVSCDKALSNSIKCTFTNLNDDEIRFKVPTKNFESVTFKNCNLTKFPKTLFKTFPKITKVDLSTSHVHQLNGNKTLNGAKTLKILDLSRNSLEEIEDFVFSEGKELVELHLSRNKIISVRPNAFAGLEKLELLDLSFNDIKILTEEVFSGLTKLQFIYVNNNDLKNLTFDLRELKDLTEFDISNNKYIDVNGWLTDLPSHIKPKLSFNYSYCNEDKTILKTWGTNIKTYIVKHSKVIDVYTYMNVRWETLDISENLLRDITNITKIQTLQNLDLSENPLSPLNVSTFSLLDDLRTLNLRSTGISLDQNYFAAQKKLTFLDISGNGLTSLDLRDLKSLSSLQTLYLHENNFTELEYIEDIKTILPNLTTISLFKNNFSCSYNILMHELFENLKIKVYDGTKVIEKEDITRMRVNCSEMSQLRPKNLEQAIFFKQITNYLGNSFQQQLVKSNRNIMNNLQIERSKETKIVSKNITDLMQYQNKIEENLISKIISMDKYFSTQLSTLTNIIWKNQSRLEMKMEKQLLNFGHQFTENINDLKNITQREGFNINQNTERLNKKVEELMSEIESVKMKYEESKSVMNFIRDFVNVTKELF
ncbi:leucine-rich repeat-containing G-protein coupled receptor 5-like [Lutzomyia longipalpis]|uniref:leucine-rich repeat-containing G-protein coupled receptor 5-like n=1 Tax=Lutzomyia longipalpis TaxID=7200 RepID=UPI00248436C9|nr:leucine-rich repeat-containing G-protein coupled receptor 5-like [Lutzomyia longipalpis]